MQYNIFVPYFNCFILITYPQNLVLLLLSYFDFRSWNIFEKPVFVSFFCPIERRYQFKFSKWTFYIGRDTRLAASSLFQPVFYLKLTHLLNLSTMTDVAVCWQVVVIWSIFFDTKTITFLFLPSESKMSASALRSSFILRNVWRASSNPIFRQSKTPFPIAVARHENLTLKYNFGQLRKLSTIPQSKSNEFLFVNAYFVIKLNLVFHSFYYSRFWCFIKKFL